jgi:Hydrazine synthase alpha subunit middle domain
MCRALSCWLWEGRTDVVTRLLAISCALSFCASLVALQNRSTHKSHVSPLLYTAAREYQPLAWLRGADRFPRGAKVFLKSGNVSKPLAPGFFATADANISFDAKAALFSGKRHANDHWQVWEIAIPGGTPRQLTHCDENCVRPMYLPSEQFVYAHQIAGRFVLEVASLNGSGPALQLTHAPGNFLPTDVLHDGRILFESGYPIENSKTAELYTVYPDGSGVEAYRCDHGHSRYSGTQVAAGDVVFAQEGKLFRFTSALAHEVQIPSPDADYAGDVIETSSGAWLVSSRATRGRYFQLHTWTPGAPHLLPLIPEANTNIVQPALLAAHAVPKRYPSGLHDWSYANVLCLNAYTSKTHIAEGSIASVRLYRRDALGTAHTQGTAPVEKDGSFYLRVPGDQPIRIDLLDAAGHTVKSEAGWFWLRGGEQRICVGCHAGPERAPDNAVPEVLIRSTVPTDLTTKSPETSAAGGH